MPPRTKKTHETIQHMLDALDSPRHPLSKWEENFLATVNEQFESHRHLSDDQFEKLEEVYVEKTD